MPNEKQIEEWDIRRFFVTTDLDQARDTLNVCRGIVETRMEAQPKRKARSDAGKPRKNGAEQTTLLEQK